MTGGQNLLEKDARRIADMFDAIAPRYDALNHLLSAGFDRRWRVQAITALELSGQETLVDLCTGTGDLALAAVQSQRAHARRVIGIDFASAMLKLAAQKVERHDATALVQLMRGDASCIPLCDGSADAVTIGFGIRNVADTRAVCDEIRRVLRPGGRLAILEFNMPSNPIIKGLYGWYFERFLPWVGRLISRHPEAYAYLPASVHAFLPPARLSALLVELGFTEVRMVSLTCGVVYLHLATRP
ncbi:MAG: bifunctional demethylmenaquinone methyltransferase/2-methoxy-6-polyprenyl-1,4-benzoquinol methylase UbiE [Acidobacteriota bacterium]|nr:bifunctional demethylmenaquinone methyltransferase/2-methoxy-6-polyprenyl-1,4-benzoquinol methylase UbiE [Acidobacteriota bacterium]MEC7768723.1 bifunctional demethylmenaquinone methyltransferase/2-methoxy-6-polyprenyl-1,4-benzoquinol methylase UbiE [Acidobacteriota bacterium]